MNGFEEKSNLSVQTFYGRRMLRSLLVFLIVCTLHTGCSVERPSPPSWDTQWHLPLVNRSYSVLDLIEEIDQEGLTFDSLGNPEIYIRQQVDTVRVADNLTSPGYSEKLVQQLGIVEIGSPEPQSFSIELSEFNPTWVGQTVMPFHFEVTEPLAEFEVLSHATVEAGKIYLFVSNHLGVDLDSLTLKLMDDYDSQILGTIEVAGGLANNQSHDDSLSLAGKTIHNQCSVILEGHSPGGELGPGEYYLETTVSFSDSLSVSHAQAKIPPFTKTLSREVTSDDSSIVTSALIKSGQLSLSIENHTDLEAQLLIRCPDLLHQGEGQTASRFLLPRESVELNYPLEGYELQPEGEEIPQSISVNLRAELPGSGEELRDFDQNDSVTASVEISELVFSEVTGRPKPTPVEFEPQTEILDLPEGLEQMHLTSAELYLTIYNDADFPADLQLHLSGDNGKEFDISGRIEAKTLPHQARKTTIVKGEQELADFLNPFPDEVTVQGQAIFNPDYEGGHISQEHGIYGEIEIRSPLSFAILDTAEMEMDIEEVDGEWEEADRLKRGEVTAEIENHLPVGAQVTIYIGEVGSDTIYTHPSTITIGPLRLSAAEVDEFGLATGCSQNSFQESLTRQQLRIFDNDLLYVAKRIVLFPTEAQGGVSIQSDDYLKIEATAELSVELGGED